MEKYYEAIDAINEILERDLVGPVFEDEVIKEEPNQYYIAGILWPQLAIKSDNVEIDENVEDVLENYDQCISAANTYYPSCMAISVMLGSGSEKICAKFSCGKYIAEPIAEENSKGYINYQWRRKPLNFNTILDFSSKNPAQTINIAEGLELVAFTRKTYKDGSKLITVGAVNKFKQEYAINNNLLSFFQCRLSLVNIDGQFIPQRNEINYFDDEVMNLEMLYRKEKNYAYGHGCSVEWEKGPSGVTVISSSFMPKKEILQMKPSDCSNQDILRMAWWQSAEKDEICREIMQFASEYDKWIKAQKEKATEIEEMYTKAASENISKCETASNRIKKCVQLLENNETALKALRLANETMLMQRVNTLKNKGKSCDEEKVRWYPFQLAFILQIVPDIVDEKSNYRDLVDLLWFPTGGGKTEAYLGLAAFTIFYRRLAYGEKGAGVSILMRYTLRLLTIQQFERACAMITACEHLRRKYKIGSEEISIGIWVGGDLTPNRIAEAEKNLEEIREGRNLIKGNPMQILQCPWCGTKLDVTAYRVTQEGLEIHCLNDKCEFSNKLPIYVVDDDVYREKPTFILSTVDKFARITWEAKAGCLFGINTKYRAPELIIQDELHLISGPLGTLTGLYETAVDRLCQKDGIKPKIIASTATIRNAKSQIKALYNRDYLQFPCQGTNIDDSYFAVTAKRQEKPARRYIGIAAPGSSMVELLVRVYSSLIFASRYLTSLDEFDDRVIDNFWTLVGYFNTLRDLGGASSTIFDRVYERYKYLINTKFNDLANKFTYDDAGLWNNNELTSRKPSADIKQTLENLEIGYPDKRAYDYILATNMLSVGIDIGRLGMMVVHSQPKTNAEYIQATSRVGRENPGLVVIMYNAMRSRDKSHYETFAYYHSVIYKFVEATSVTPFAARAVDKALHSVYIALLRHLVEGMADNEGAGRFEPDNKDVKQLEEYIFDRIARVDRGELPYAKEHLAQFKKLWEYYAKTKDLVYTSYTTGESFPLLQSAEGVNITNLPSTLNSLRNVDRQSNIYIEED
ncbi:helicase-related protein [Tepidanaerobacter syntrophicus]|uniref:helicase-related protein n=1 Tax=Tepidanaerobacter syntrophicus TaxID=224999 RepID=UPI001BD59A66|nr:helicase-related protein [Tepidanaerobacter syntrophicus]